MQFCCLNRWMKHYLLYQKGSRKNLLWENSWHFIKTRIFIESVSKCLSDITVLLKQAGKTFPNSQSWYSVNYHFSAKLLTNVYCDHCVKTSVPYYSIKNDQHANVSFAPYSIIVWPLLKNNFNKTFILPILIFENKVSEIVYKKSVV